MYRPTIRELEPVRAECCRAPIGRLDYFTVITTRQMSIYIDRTQIVKVFLLVNLKQLVVTLFEVKSAI